MYGGGYGLKKHTHRRRGPAAKMEPGTCQAVVRRTNHLAMTHHLLTINAPLILKMRNIKEINLKKKFLRIF
jgi:hypothetical protein